MLLRQAFLLKHMWTHGIQNAERCHHFILCTEQGFWCRNKSLLLYTAFTKLPHICNLQDITEPSTREGKNSNSHILESSRTSKNVLNIVMGKNTKSTDQHQVPYNLPVTSYVTEPTHNSSISSLTHKMIITTTD
jgi:hypothetical protein